MNSKAGYTIERFERQPTLGMRTRTPVERIAAFYDRAYPLVLECIRAHGLEPAGPPFALMRNADPTDLDVEVGWPVAHALAGAGEAVDGEIVGGEIPPSRVATFVHVGSYADLPDVYRKLQQWMSSEGLHGTGTMYEMYLDDPRETPVAERRTKIAFPLRDG